MSDDLPGPDDERWMRRALSLARAQLGKVAPNPAVGCVLVRDDEVIAEAATADGGRPHAEEAALAEAGERARGAVAYVTLEPCSRRSGGAASCTDRLIRAGVARVIIACRDPNPDAAHGATLLEKAGVPVLLGVMEHEANQLNRGFFYKLRTGRPWLAIDDDADSYDATLELEADETVQAALERLAAEGATRVRVATDSALIADLRRLGLLDD
ncbi:MAG: bifunctional diaminohydroxyphosphoribosylaminopyrimidine deaminase/5-amino-6-(5-phosphoribosylamino)uracil reductase RibD [Hyphomonadaceae bacterium]